MSRPAEQYLEEYATASRRFATAVARSEPGLTVPAAPTWSTYDLVVHLGNVHGWAATIVETGQRAPEHHDAPHTKEPQGLAEWYAGKAEDLYTVLCATAPDAPCWNFAHARRSAAFWFRRQLHETMMHLVDLDQAEGRQTTLSTSWCVDGVDEVLAIMLPLMRARGRVASLTAPLTLRAVDTAVAWTLPVSSDGVAGRVRRHSGFAALTSGGLGLFAVDNEAAADAVNGPAAVLWQLLWKRTGRSPVDGSAVLTHPDLSYDGDADAVMRFLASNLTP